MSESWPVPKFAYGQHVRLLPVEGVAARVVDLHLFGAASTIEYDVRYFHDGTEKKVRAFEDELEAL